MATSTQPKQNPENQSIQFLHHSSFEQLHQKTEKIKQNRSGEDVVLGLKNINPFGGCWLLCRLTYAVVEIKWAVGAERCFDDSEFDEEEGGGGQWRWS